MKKGFVTLLAVIVLGMIALGLAISFSFHSMQTANNARNNKYDNLTKALVNSCAEIALYRIRANNSLTGSGNVRLGNDICTYSISGGGGVKTINISGTINNSTRRLIITTSALNPIAISTWQEI